MNIFSITISLLIILLIIFLYKTENYIIHNSLPYKKLTARILIGIVTIDRDIRKAPKMYSHLSNSIDNFLRHNNTKIDIIVITRDSDLKSINFWNNKYNIKVITVPHYLITKRHNFKEMAKQYNYLIYIVKSQKYDKLIIIESDVYIKENTISNLLNNTEKYHIAVSYGIIPWAGYPVVAVSGLLYPKIKDARLITKKDRLIGAWTGAIAIRREVFDHCSFKKDKFDEIEGQDIGFFKQVHRNRYSAILLDEVTHDYK